jgi:hypothetical protein
MGLMSFPDELGKIQIACQQQNKFKQWSKRTEKCLSYRA